MDLIRSPEMVTAVGLPRPLVFCAGSIEMGAASDWQAQVAAKLTATPGTLLSPRREEWDASWPQTPDFAPFNEQVTWELDGILDHADLLFFHFEAGTRSPITLLELGLALGRGLPAVISCPPEFWRHGNVVITANRFGERVHDTIDAAVADLADRARQLALR